MCIEREDSLEKHLDKIDAREDHISNAQDVEERDRRPDHIYL